MELASCMCTGNICSEDFPNSSKDYEAKSRLSKIEDFSSFSEDKLHH